MGYLKTKLNISLSVQSGVGVYRSSKSADLKDSIVSDDAFLIL